MKPRPVLANKTYLVTRRCSERRYLLLPLRLVNQMVSFCLAYAASRWGMKVHAFCALSNHTHLVYTDVGAESPRFLHWMHCIVARSLNALHRHWENFWAPGSYSRVELADPEDMLEKIVYTLSNPVAAGLVSHGEKWPGVRYGPFRDEPRKVTVHRPKFFFGKRSKLPKVVSLLIEVPEALAELHGPGVGAMIYQAVRAREAEIRAQFEAEGRTFLGRKRLFGLSPLAAPGTPAPHGNLNPRFAAKDPRRMEELKAAFEEFLSAYREALRRFSGGVRGALRGPAAGLTPEPSPGAAGRPRGPFKGCDGRG